VRYLIDTDHISLLQRPPGSELTAFLTHCAVHRPSDIVYCVVSFHEQVSGAHSYITRAKTTAEVIRGYELMSGVLQTYSRKPVLPFDLVSQVVFDQLAASKLGLKTMDQRIAAIARVNNLTLVTRNTSDFAKIPGLPIEEWTK
jgi:tRNA(fMet)-specific endonuclease VapC